jgi:nucleoside-diphosphate-sugar epimerase
MGNILDKADCRRATAGMDVVVHLAAVSEETDTAFEVNTLSTFRILEAARDSGVTRVVYASSNCVYGHCFRVTDTPFPVSRLPIDESSPRIPEDTYGLSKIVGEQTLRRFRRAYGIETAALRLNWVWGAREVEWWLTEGQQNLRLQAPYFWAYVSASDAAHAFRLAVDAPVLPADDAYNVSAADTMAEVASADLIDTYLPHLAPYGAAMPGRASFFSSAKATAVLGFEPRTTWRETGES